MKIRVELDGNIKEEEIVIRCQNVSEEIQRLRNTLEDLPGYFMRISKSTILNTNKVYSIQRNLTASSVVEF